MMFGNEFSALKSQMLLFEIKKCGWNPFASVVGGFFGGKLTFDSIDSLLRNIA